MANVRVNEIPIIVDAEITEEDSTIIIDRETRETKRITLKQLTSYLTSSISSASVHAPGPEYSIQFNSGSYLSGSQSLLYNYDTNILSGATAHFQTISASNYEGLNLEDITASIEITKLIVSSSIALASNERAVFALNNISSLVSITLPSASIAENGEYYIIKADSQDGTVEILASNPDTINGDSSYYLNGPFQSITLMTDGTDWFIF